MEMWSRPEPRRSETVSSIKMHYAIEDAQVGAVKVAIFAFRCGSCDEDFHIDHRPNFCPKCGEKLDREEYFGNAARAARRCEVPAMREASCVHGRHLPTLRI